MYLDYWGLRRSPFDNVPDPQMFFVRRGTAENAVDELLFAVTEGNECLAVVVGDVGLGKTMTLRMVLNELDSERYRIAYLTNPDLTFLQLLREVVGQLLGQPCQVRAKDVLLEEFNRLLFEAAFPKAVEYSPPNMHTKVEVPGLKMALFSMGGLYVLFVLIIIVGASNAVNLTDGLDGLAIGASIISLLT
ncbi:MAG TPA: AAA family ATPase, partial [Acidobacteriota bacterium]|nr:AAA family ATPase [Acidobacteriota bacterium]